MAKVKNQPIPCDSPVEERRKQLPRGDGEWPGYSVVYERIKQGCEALAASKHTHLSGEHVEAMAILGSGHEETMKAEVHRMLDRGLIQLGDRTSQIQRARSNCGAGFD